MPPVCGDFKKFPPMVLDSVQPVGHLTYKLEVKLSYLTFIRLYLKENFTIPMKQARKFAPS